MLSIEANCKKVWLIVMGTVCKQRKVRTDFHAIRIKISSVTDAELLDFLQAATHCLQLVEDGGQSFTNWLLVKSRSRSVITQNVEIC